jgi:PKD repeat protein
LSIQIPVSGLPTVLGNDPGNAVLSRIELIISHTWNRDINMRLTSPSGQTRNLVLNRFGNGDNFGNPGTCPAAPFVLEDGGAALVTGNTSNVTGPYAPEESLSGFTGDPNGTWTLFVCDNEADDFGNMRFLNVVFGVRDCDGVVDGPAMPGSSCDDGDPATINDIYSAGCACVGSPNVLYSINSGNITSNIWSYTPGGSASGVAPDQYSSIVIESGHTISVSGSRNVRDLAIEAGGSIDVGSGSLTVHGTSFELDGTFTAGTGTLLFAGNDLATITGSAVLDVFNLTVNNTEGVNVDVVTNVKGTLLLNDGDFEAVASVKLVSDATRTARLGVVASGASYTGDLTVERYIPGGASNWRLLGTPVQGRTVADWNDDFYTAGFTGSNYPNFYSGGVLWPTIRWYDETNTGTGLNDGLTGVTNTTNALVSGRGYATWSGDAIGGTSAFIVDVTGPPTIASSPITLPLTWTNTGTPGTDGWNLVGNPLPSPISFTGITRGADVQNAYWIFNPATGNNASWSSGISTNGATGVIQSSQGFWMRTTGPAVTSTVSESAKSGSGTGGFFGGQELIVVPMVRLSISSAINNYRDEAVVAFHEGAPGSDALDAPSYVFAHPQAPQISTLSTDGDAMAISMYGSYSNSISIPVLVNAAVTGTYTITASDMELLGGLSCLVLEDLVTGAVTPMQEDATYNFTLAANASATTPRFMLHASAPIVFSSQAVTCSSGTDGAAEVMLTNGPTDVIWSDAAGNVLLSQPGMPVGEASIAGLPAGNYQVSVGTSTACGVLTHLFTITEPFGMEATAQATAATCANASDGSIAVDVLGGSAPYNYVWNTGATTATVDGIAPGEYAVSITDANGCTTTLEQVLVDGPDAITGEVLAESAVAANETIFFASSAAPELAHSWDFGDGNSSTETAPEHVYGIPGDYTVTLTLSDGQCSHTVQHNVSVYVTTGVADLDTNGLRAWATGSAIVLVNEAGQEGDVNVYDAAGHLVATSRLAAGTERLEVPTMDWPAGIYRLSVTSTADRWSVGLPVIR